jgi:hypothetical protein
MRKLSALLLVALVVIPGAFAAITVDGTLDASGYTLLTPVSTTPETKVGFGTAMDASQIWVGEDAANIYFFIQGVTNNGSSDGIAFILGTSGQLGATAGTNLGNIGGLGGGNEIFGDTSNNAWQMEFEADQGWFISTGGGFGQFINMGDWTGNTKTFVGDVAGGPITVGGNTYAMNNSGTTGGAGSSTGFELGIARSNLGGIGVGATVDCFAIVVSNTSFFSDDSPDATLGSNPGFNPNFAAIGTGSDQTFSYTTLVPVELSVFSSD